MPLGKVRQGPQDGESPTWKLPSTTIPEPIIPGMRGWKTSDGWQVLRLHYSADPERATQEWIDLHLAGYRGGMAGRDWRREMEISFEDYAGAPVYPLFDPDRSVTPTRYNPHLPLLRGWDFGYRHPAVVWAQQWTDGTFCSLHELYPTLNSDDLPGLSTGGLVQMVLAETERLFPESASDASAEVLDFCDPAGTQHKDASDYSSIEILQQHGIEPEYAVVGRKNRIAYLRRYIEEPGRFRVNPHCTLLIKALAGAYRYPELRAGGADREMPDLGKKVQEEPYIHIIDALEYIAACTLEIPYTPSKQAIDPTSGKKTAGDLAELYLGMRPFGQPGQDYDEAKDAETSIEYLLSELMGVDGGLDDAFLQD